MLSRCTKTSWVKVRTPLDPTTLLLAFYVASATKAMAPHWMAWAAKFDAVVLKHFGCKVSDTTTTTETTSNTGEPATLPTVVAPSAVPTTTTSAPCPSGSPSASATLSASPDPEYPGATWDVSVTGTVMTTAQVELGLHHHRAFSRNRQPASSRCSNDLADASRILAPGQSLPLSDTDGPIFASPPLSIGPVTVTWTWPLGSPYLMNCPTGGGVGISTLQLLTADRKPPKCIGSFPESWAKPPQTIRTGYQKMPDLLLWRRMTAIDDGRIDRGSAERAA